MEAILSASPLSARHAPPDCSVINPDPPPPYTSASSSHSGIIASVSTETLRVQDQPALLRRFVTRTGGIFLVKTVDLENIEAFICPYSADPSNPHIMEGKGSVSGEVFKRAKTLPPEVRNYIAQNPEGNGVGDLLCIMEKGHQETDLFPDAGFNRKAEEILVICQGEKGIDICEEEMPLSQFPEHWHSKCLRKRDTDANPLHGTKMIRDLKDYVIQQFTKTESKLQSLALAQQRSEEKVEYGIKTAELGIKKADWIKDNAIAIDFDREKKTIASMFENVEAHIGEIEGKVEKLIKENNDKGHILTGLQESVATKLKALESKKLDHALQRIDKLEALQTRITNCDGQIVWRIDNFNEKRKKAISGEEIEIFSDPFFTNPRGYKLCISAYLDGDSTGKGSHISLFFNVMKGEYDALQKWPFQQKITLELFSQISSERNSTGSFTPDPANLRQSPCFVRPKSDATMNSSWGFPEFMSLETLLDKKDAYLKDDVLFLGARTEAPSGQSAPNKKVQALQKAAPGTQKKSSGFFSKK